TGAGPRRGVPPRPRPRRAGARGAPRIPRGPPDVLSGPPGPRRGARVPGHGAGGGRAHPVRRGRRVRDARAAHRPPTRRARRRQRPRQESGARDRPLPPGRPRGRELGALRLRPRDEDAPARARGRDAAPRRLRDEPDRLPTRLRARAAGRRGESRRLRLAPRRAERRLPSLPRVPAGPRRVIGRMPGACRSRGLSDSARMPAMTARGSFVSLAASLLLVSGPRPVTAQYPVFDAHIHYSRPDWDAYPPERALALLARAGVRRALVSSTPDDGTLKLYARSPSVVVPFLRPYRTREDLGGWHADAGVAAYVEERLKRGIYRGIGEFHLGGADVDAPVVRRIAELAAERDLFLHTHVDADTIETLLARYPKVRFLWAHAGLSADA